MMIIAKDKTSLNVGKLEKVINLHEKELGVQVYELYIMSPDHCPCAAVVYYEDDGSDATLVVPSDYTQWTAERAIAHEIKHIEQVQKGRLIHDCYSIIFNGKVYPKYKNSTFSPWEIEARRYANKFKFLGWVPDTARVMVSKFFDWILKPECSRKLHAKVGWV